MLMNVYSIYDSKGEYWIPIWIARSHADAIRDFTRSVSSPGTPIGDHPADFQLVCVGTWDDDSGTLIPHEVKQTLGSGIEFQTSEALQAPDLLTPLSGDPA